MSDLIHLDRGRVALSTDNDPAIERVTGYSRFVLGMDLGRSDPSALVLLHDERLPEWDSPLRQRLGARRRTVVWADRVSDTAYTDLARHVASLLANPSLAGRTDLIVDATGLGQPFCDVLDEGGIEHFAVTMTAGQTWKRRGNKVSVAKNVLLEHLAAGCETGAIEIAKDLPLRNQLIQEVASFELETTAAGNLVLAGGGKGHHADMAVALALSFFSTEHLSGYVVGQSRLTGWY